MPENARPRVAIIDYQMGNLFSVEHACSAVGLEPVITSDPAAIRAADAAILPGVGAFGEAMANIRRLGLVPPILGAIDSGKPFLGICLGLQLLFQASEEFGPHEGLGVVEGSVKRFPNAPDPAGEAVKVPQIGWNRIEPRAGGGWEGTPLAGIAAGEYMYFVHSFYVAPARPEDALSVSRYAGLEYCSSVRRGNVFACQFHPEKSAHEGLRIYRNWAEGIK